MKYFGLDYSIMIATAKRTPDKWGKVTVVAHIPILFEKEARKAKPDHFFVLSWHFIEEFKNWEKKFLMSVGRCILPAHNFTLI